MLNQDTDLSDPSHSSRPERRVLVPQRAIGLRRVEDLLRAAAAVIAERGYDAATMAEIATRAGAQIGSLYRFFPNKHALGDALLDRHAALVDAIYDEIEATAPGMTTDALADALFAANLNRRRETRALGALLDARDDRSARRRAVRSHVLARVAGVLRRRAPWLDAASASDMADAVMRIVKVVAALEHDPATRDRDAGQHNEPDAPGSSPGAIMELRAMTRLYLAERLSPPPSIED